MKSLITTVGAGFMMAATGAAAQDAPDPAAPIAEPVPAPVPIQTTDIPPAAAPAPTIRKTGFSDEQVAAFVRAALQMRELNSDAAMGDLERRTEAEIILSREGIEPETYSAIGAAASGDPAMAERVQLVIEAVAQERES